MRQSHQHEKNRFGESFLYSTYLPKDRQSDKSDWREKSRGEEEAPQAKYRNVMRCKRTTPYDHGKRWSEDTAEQHAERHSCQKPHTQDGAHAAREMVLLFYGVRLPVTRSCLPFSRLFVYEGSLQYTGIAPPQDNPDYQDDQTKAIPDNLIGNILRAICQHIIALSHRVIAHILIYQVKVEDRVLDKAIIQVETSCSHQDTCNHEGATCLCPMGTTTPYTE